MANIIEWYYKLSKGGAGLYAAMSIARLGHQAELLTVLSPEIDEYHISVWVDMGISFQYAKNDKNYCIPKYLVTGFENYSKKVSRPMTEIKYIYDYLPDLPIGTEGVLLFPINHSIPKSICFEASKNNKFVFLDPKPNEGSISDAKDLLEYVDVLLVNEEELLLLSSKYNLNEAIETLLAEGPDYIIVKRGIKGCIIAQKNKELCVIPSYKSNAVCTLGSGDVFDGAVAATFIETKDMEYSVKLASCMAACFIENIEIERMPTKKAVEFYMNNRGMNGYSSSRNLIIYLAGPFFSQQEVLWVNYIHQSLESCGLKILSPSKENGIINTSFTPDIRKATFISDLELLQKADIVVALLDHDDAGTSFEIGYAYSHGKPVIGLKTSADKLNNMIQYGCNPICDTVDKLVSEVYKYARE